MAAVVVVQDRKQIHFNSAKWLLLFDIQGIPIGLLLLVYGNENIVKTILGNLIISYLVFSECLAMGTKDFGDGKSLIIFLSHLFSSEDISTIN